MQLDSGSVLCLQPEIFSLGRYDYVQDEAQKKMDTNSSVENIILPPINNNTSNIDTHNSNTANNKHTNFKSTRGILSNKARNRILIENRDNHNSNDNQSINSNTHSINSTTRIASTDVFHPNPFPPLENPNFEDRKYNIKMVFTKFTTYLTVPYRKFVKILNKREGKVHSVLPTISNEIKWYLNNTNQIVADRIKNILPWIMGNNMNFIPKTIPPKPSNIDFYICDTITAKEFIDIDYASTTIGSFTKVKKVLNKKNEKRSSYYSKTSLSIQSQIKKSDKYLPHSPDEIALHNILLDLRKTHRTGGFSSSKKTITSDINNLFITNKYNGQEEEDGDESSGSYESSDDSV